MGEVKLKTTLIDGASAGIKEIRVNTEDLKEALGEVGKAASNFSDEMSQWSLHTQALDSITNAVKDLSVFYHDLVAAYNDSAVTGAKLETVMRQRMNATQEEIEQIRALCSEQQAVGVVEDDVQAAGAQQMATFLGQKDSLLALIPAMNNLLTQQNGVNATMQDAVSIGNMMGKAMQGQVDVLQRVGVTYSFAI